MSIPAQPLRLHRLDRLGPASLLVGLVASLLVLFSFFRLAFVLLYWSRVRAVPDFGEIFVLGLRFDAMTLGVALAPLALALLLLPSGIVRRCGALFALYAAALTALALFFELASFGFLDEYDSRPNRLFLEYLHKSDELTATILKAYPLLVVVAALGVGAVAWFAWRIGGRLVREHEGWSARRRLVLAPLLLLILFGAARGGVAHAANRSAANFSNSHLANELVPNGLYTIACAALDMRMERSAAELYGDLPRDEVIARVRRWAGIEPGACPDPALPVFHQPPPVPRLARPRNLVILLEESLGAQFVQRLGGLHVTPHLEELSQQGLWFDHMYATGTRTVRGLEGVVCGFPPSPSSSVVKLGLSQGSFFTMAQLLAQRGYACDFLYGGTNEFDNMQTFLLSNGFQNAITQADFADPAFLATWGVSDEDLVRRANETFVAHGDKPFFALVLSTSNHTPFEFPDGRIELYDAEKATRNNSVKYADYAIGLLFELARKEAYFENTLWVVVADHDTRAPSDDLLPLEHFHIPALILGPGVEPRVESRIASQIDLMPTALHLLGLAPAHPMPGRDLFALAPDDPGRALLQYNLVNGFLAGDRLVVHQPYDKPLQFAVSGDELVPAPLDPELERDALAHVLLPWMLYSEQSYRLP
jgi:phosphoglycerol transferase MdoB-like AlkP superfamily enzyme